MMSERDDRACDSWRVGQRRRGDLNVGMGAEDFTVISACASGGWYVDRIRDGTKGFIFCEHWPSVLLADSPGTAPAAYPRVEAMKNAATNAIRNLIAPVTPGTAPGENRQCSHDGETWTDCNPASYCGHQFSRATPAAAAPAHVCKGRPCGEALTHVGTPNGGWFAAFPGGSRSGRTLLTFCSPACRDAWKPGAKTASRATCGAALPYGGDYCLRDAGPGGACDTHRKKPEATAACPAWCGLLYEDDRVPVDAAIRPPRYNRRATEHAFCSQACFDRTKGAEKPTEPKPTAQLAHAPMTCAICDRAEAPPTMRVCRSCEACAVVVSTDGNQAPWIAEPLATFILPGEVPARRPATDGQCARRPRRHPESDPRRKAPRLVRTTPESRPVTSARPRCR